MGSPAVTQTWTATTVAATPAVTTPTIATPGNGSTNVGTSSGIQITGSGYATTGGAGAQASSEWEVYANGLPTTVQSTSTISAVSAPAVPSPGDAYGGGYFAGQISTAGNGVADYNLVVAPKTSGALNGQFGGASLAGIQWKTSNSGPDTNAQSEVYGATAMLANNSNLFPMFDWCKNNTSGPNAGNYDATNTAATGIGGYNDWYIPAKNELAVLYFFLKPDTTANFTSSGSNPNSVAPYTPNTNYGPGFPNVTSNALFAGGAQAFPTARPYWSATESLNIYAWRQGFDDGRQDDLSFKGGTHYARAIRRVAA
jgi:hypothetical protein